MLRTSEPRRERLEISRDAAGNFAVVNGLGATVKDLWIADASGRVARASAIAPGARAVTVLVAGMTAVNSGMHTLRSYYEDENWWTDMTGVARSRVPTGILRRGTYVAVLDGAPFIDKGLSRRAKVQAASLVIGIMEQGQ